MKTLLAVTRQRHMIYFLLVKRINYHKADRRKFSSGIRFVERAHRACPMRACCCMLKDTCVCVCVCSPSSHVCGGRVVCVFKLNKLSSRYSRIPTSRLEIRDFARTMVRLFAMVNCAKRIANYAITRYFRRNFAHRCQRARFLPVHANGKSSVCKFDDKTSWLSSVSRGDQAGRCTGCDK